MPVDEFRCIRVIKQIHGDGDAFAKADQRSRNRAVIADGTDSVPLAISASTVPMRSVTSAGPLGAASARLLRYSLIG